jgi:murein tripeptide amidase MpaA
MRKHPTLALLLAVALAARPSPLPAAEERPHIRAFVSPATREQLRDVLASGLDVTHAHGQELDLLLTRQQLDALVSKGYAVTVENENVYAPAEEGGIPRGGGSFLPEYTSYSEMVAALNGFAAAHPSRAALSSIGTSHQGRALWALKISDNVGVDENEPEVLILGCHHAREVITVTIPLAIADSLLSNYGSDAQMTEWVDEREIWIVPCVNPDGYVYVETTDLFWRKNRRVNAGGSFGVDLNRNYAYEWGHDDNGSSPTPTSSTYRGPSPVSEPEIAAVTSFIDAHDFAVSISYHSFGNWVLWGPGYKPGLSADEDIHRGFGELVAAVNGYLPGNPASSTIYITNGDTDDWAYHALSHEKIYAFTPEVGNSSDYFNPPAERIPTLVIEGSVAAWKALEYADRPERLAPPGQPAFEDILTSGPGSYTLTWSAPEEADMQVSVYELVEKTGGSVAAEGFESGITSYNPGGWTQSATRAFSGSFSFYSGQGDELNRIALAKEPYQVQPGDSFTFRAWYQIESNWDYAYAILSTDGGRSFVNLAGTATTMSDPNGNNADNGITGISAGWQLHTYDLSAWVGEFVWLGFRYYTDSNFIDDGIWIDDVYPVQEWAASTVLSSSIAGESYAVASRPIGTYTYSVRGKDAEDDWGYPSSPATVIVDSSTEIAVLSPGPRFFLSPGAPNPFGARTSISFGLPAPGEHSLVVYDVAGRRVRTLSRGRKEAGVHAVAWDGRNEIGRLMPSGVYFCTLQAESGALHRRVILQH